LGLLLHILHPREEVGILLLLFLRVLLLLVVCFHPAAYNLESFYIIDFDFVDSRGFGVLGFWGCEFLRTPDPKMTSLKGLTSKCSSE
jgi:hypothetical protein